MALGSTDKPLLVVQDKQSSSKDQELTDQHVPLWIFGHMVTCSPESLKIYLPFETIIIKIGSRMKFVVIAIRKVILKPSELPSVTMTK